MPNSKADTAIFEGKASASEARQPGDAVGGSEGRGAARLENTTNNSSAPFPGSRSDARWWKLDWLRKESKMRRQRICMTRAYGLNVSVKQGASSIGYGGLMACASRCCPVCAPNIYGRNRDDIRQAVRAWREGEGGVVLFGTFTVRHHLGQSFDELKAGVSAAWAAVTSGRGWVNDRKTHGVEHWVRVFEEKWSPVTGWHLHVHYLVFVAPGSNTGATKLLASMFGRWSRALAALGLSASVDGQDLHEVEGDDADKVLGDYFTKQASSTELLTHDRIALELTMRDGKFTGSSLTPGELLTLAVAGDAQGQQLWAEYERGMHNRRVIAWSRGLRQLVGIGDEISDQESAELDGEEERKIVLSMRSWAYRKVLSFGKRRELLSRVWENGPAEAVAWLASWGVPAVEGDIGIEFLDDEWEKTA